MKNFFELGSSEPLDPLRFVTSWLLPPSILFFLRALFSLFIFVSIFTIIGIDGEDYPPAQKKYMSTKSRVQFINFSTLSSLNRLVYFENTI